MGNIASLPASVDHRSQNDTARLYNVVLQLSRQSEFKFSIPAAFFTVLSDSVTQRKTSRRRSRFRVGTAAKFGSVNTAVVVYDRGRYHVTSASSRVVTPT